MFTALRCAALGLRHEKHAAEGALRSPCPHLRPRARPAPRLCIRCTGQNLPLTVNHSPTSRCPSTFGAIRAGARSSHHSTRARLGWAYAMCAPERNAPSRSPKSLNAQRDAQSAGHGRCLCHAVGALPLSGRDGPNAFALPREPLTPPTISGSRFDAKDGDFQQTPFSHNGRSDRSACSRRVSLRNGERTEPARRRCFGRRVGRRGPGDAAGPDAQGDGLARTDSSASDSGGGGGTFAGTSTGGGGSSDVRASDGGLGSRGASAPQPEGATTPGSGGVTSDGGPSGGLRLLQGQLGTLATDAVSGPLRIYHDGIESSERLCVGSICVTGAITP